MVYMDFPFAMILAIGCIDLSFIRNSIVEIFIYQRLWSTHILLTSSYVEDSEISKNEDVETLYEVKMFQHVIMLTK